MWRSETSTTTTCVILSGGGLGAGVEGPLLFATLSGLAELRQQFLLIRRMPLAAQVFPLRILGFDKRDLFGVLPTLQLLLARDCVEDLVIDLEVQQSRDVVFSSKPLNHMLFMLPDAPPKISRHADVQRARVTREDVNVVSAFSLRIHAFLPRKGSFDSGGKAASAQDDTLGARCNVTDISSARDDSRDRAPSVFPIRNNLVTFVPPTPTFSETPFHHLRYEHIGG